MVQPSSLVVAADLPLDLSAMRILLLMFPRNLKLGSSALLCFFLIDLVSNMCFLFLVL